MIKNIFSLTIIVLLSIFSPALSAQIKIDLKKKVNNEANQRVNQRTNQAIDKTFDKVEDGIGSVSGRKKRSRPRVLQSIGRIR